MLQCKTAAQRSRTQNAESATLDASDDTTVLAVAVVGTIINASLASWRVALDSTEPFANVTPYTHSISDGIALDSAVLSCQYQAA